MCGINAVEAQRRAFMFIFCHAPLKMAFLLHKEATVRFDLIIGTVPENECGVFAVL